MTSSAEPSPAELSPVGPPLSTILAGDSAAVPSGWSQGRGTFGGLLLALGLVGARRELPEPRPARAMVATFPAPVGIGEVAVDVRTLRHGRAVSQLAAEVRQGGDLGCLVLASFGVARHSAVAVDGSAPPVLPPPDALPALAPASIGGPEFTRHFDYRFALGARPYSGADVREIGGWCRFRAEPAALGEEHVVALVDAWPSPAISRLTAPAPAATITWSLELLPIEEDLDPAGWWLYRAELEAAADGYAHSAARLWTPSGRLAALSRQAVAVFG